MSKLENFQNVFIEANVYDPEANYYLKIFHNCGNSDDNYIIQFIGINGIERFENQDEFICIDQNTATLLSLISPYVFCQAETWHPITKQLMEVISTNIMKFTNILLYERIDPELLDTLMDEDDDEFIDYLINFRNFSANTLGYWEALFENKQSIIDFFDAFQWYLLEYRGFKDMDNDVIINIQGLYANQNAISEDE